MVLGVLGLVQNRLLKSPNLHCQLAVALNPFSSAQRIWLCPSVGLLRIGGILNRRIDLQVCERNDPLQLLRLQACCRQDQVVTAAARPAATTAASGHLS